MSGGVGRYAKGHERDARMHAPTPHKRVELSCQPGMHDRAPGFLVSPRRCPSPAEPPHTRRRRDPRIADKALVGPVYNDHLFFATWGLGLLCVIMSWARRYLFVSNADNGQTAPLMPIMLELAQRGCQCILVSAAKVLSRVQAIQRLGSFPVQTEAGSATGAVLKTHPLLLHSLGESPVLTYLNFVEEYPERFHEHCCRKPGDVMGWTKLYTELVPDSTDEYLRIVHLVRDAVDALDPDMIIVDNFSPFAVDGVRLTKRPFIETAPGSAMGLANRVNPFKQPLAMSGGRSEAGGLSVVLRNTSYVFRWLYFALYDPWSIRRRQFRKDVLRLTAPSLMDDAIMPPSPGVLPQQIATITFNVAGLDIYAPSAYDRSVFFVGPCFPPQAQPDAQQRADDEVIAWMDKMHAEGRRVVCINMGTIYYYQPQDYAHMVQALHMIHEQNPNVAFLWKIAQRPKHVQNIPSEEEAALPPYVRRLSWIPSMTAVMEHPALAVMMHHGGGNSLNECLAYGIPQFCISQWVDTHDIGLCIRHSGVGLWSEYSPDFVPEDICSQLLQLVEDKDHTFRHTALSWKLKTQQAGGTKFAADLIQSYVTDYTYAGGSSKAPMPHAM